MKNKNLITKIINNNMYCIPCYLFDKKYESSSDTVGKHYDNYYVKITDKEYIVNDWIEVSEEIYLVDEKKKLTLVMLDKSGKDILEIIDKF